jgi:amino acid adenylation domain-containing protein
MSKKIEEIAIIGMSGAFPGANNIDLLWKLLIQKKEGISTFSREQLLAAGESPEDIDNASYVPRGGFLEEAESFDNDFFNMTMGEALITDPQQRLFMTHSWLALEDSGYDPARIEGAVGVFAGEGVPEYWFLQKKSAVSRDLADYRLMIGNDKDYLATKVSYKLNLKGPSFNVQSACSTSLAAVGIACQSLQTYGCDMALAGGVTVTALRGRGYLHYEGMIYSKTGRCRPFDRDADGTVFGEGVGVVCLKRLTDALEDGDFIYAVIKSVALNNDGSDKAGFAAPSAAGQAEVIELAQGFAGVGPEDVGFVETHGTATSLGDAIEIGALIRAFRRGTEKSGYCYLGALKANIGHLDAAAGVASLIKTALIVNSGKIPPLMNFEAPNPRLGMEASPFLINTETVDWPLRNGRRIAGISSFGIGGTNVHVILESPPAGKARAAAKCAVSMPMLLSAKSASSLEAEKKELASFLDANPSLPPDGVAAKVSRALHDFPYRWGSPAASRELLIEDLKKAAPTPVPAGSPGCVFVFPGQGSQFPGMAKAYYGVLPAFSRWIDEGIACAQSLGLADIGDCLLRDSSDLEVSRTSMTQPLLFIIEYALAQELIDRGIEPVAVAGHSIGEYAAAAVAGVMSFADGLGLMERRGFWMQQAPEGAMTAVFLPAAKVDPYVSGGISISLYNTDSQVVLSGGLEAIADLEERLAADGISFSRIRTSHAFHSPLMEGILDGFRREIDPSRFKEASIPFLSNLDGAWIPGSMDWVEYWVKQLRSPVRFDLCIRALEEMPDAQILEAGPGKVLSNFLRPAGGAKLPPIPTLPTAKADARYFESCMIRCWAEGIAIRWPDAAPMPETPILFPGYAFDKKAFWAEGAVPASAPSAQRRQAEAHEALQNSPPPIKTTTGRDAAIPEDRTVLGRVAGAWKRMLGLPDVDLDAGFFDYGGDSLMAVELVEGVKAEFGIEFPLSSFLKAPTVSGMRDFVESKPAREAPSAATIPEREEGARAYLSPQQERLWFLHELEPELPLYNLVHVLKVEGRYDLETLRRAMERFFARHEVFRTRIAVGSSGPELSISEEALVPIQVIDLSGKDRKSAEEELAAFVRAEARKPLDFSRFPIVKSAICAFGPEECRICLFIPHIFTDGWSSEIYLHEMHDLYSLVEKGEGDLPQPAPRYSDYAAWAHLKKAGGKASPELAAFWREYLKGIPEVHQLPLDRPRPKRSTGVGGLVSFELSDEISGRIKEACARYQVTPHLFFLSSLVLLVWKYSAQGTVVIGTPYANRELEGLKGVFGCFIETIPLRFDLDGGTRLENWFGYVKKQFLDAWSMSDMGIDEIVESLGTPREANVNPVYQILFAYQSYIKRSKGEGLEFGSEFVDRGVSENDIALYMWDSGHFTGAVDYSGDLFEEESIKLFVRNFQTLIFGLLGSADSDLAALPFVDDRVMEEIRAANATEVPGFLGNNLVDLFRDSCAANGSAVAVRYKGRSFSYDEIDRESELIAGRLVGSGAESGSFVGVYLNRSEILLASLLGVMKAGCAYVPLDPYFPFERLRAIVEDSGLRLVVTEESLSNSALFSSGLAIERLIADAGRDGVAADSRPRPSPTIGAEKIAYMLFTSGSTGRPKGVPISHGALANLLLSMKVEPGMSSSDRVLALTTVSFDISGLELYLPLICGASLVMVDQESALDSSLVSDLIERERITFLQATPSRMTMLLESGWKARGGMKLLVGGEAWSRGLARKLLETGAEVWNVYGPTETTIWSSVHRVLDWERDPPIGKPIANTRFYVLDSGNRILPLGMPGELGIAGAGLTAGYHNRPDLNEERFVGIDGAAGKGVERVYRTGDMALAGIDGVYRCLGRSDGQVKIRGFRIELGEIERALATFPSIREAVCAVWARSEDDRRVVAYYRSDEKLAEGGLRVHLGRVLPDYMIPSHFVRMEDFPKTPNGKIDRKAFSPPICASTVEAERIGMPPRNRMEASILELWREILGQDGFGVTENFFDLGGHSLLATRLVAEMNGRLGKKWTLRDLFERPTIEGLAGLPSRVERGRLPLVFAAKEVGGRTPLFLSSGVYESNYYQEDSETSWERDFLRYFSSILGLIGKDRPIYGLRPRGIFKGERFRSSVESMAKEYLTEIKRIQPVGPYLVGGECLGGNIAYEVAQRLRAGGDAVTRLVLLDTYRGGASFEARFRLNEMLRSPLKRIRSARQSLKGRPLGKETAVEEMRRLRKTLLPLSESDREYRRLERGNKTLAHSLIRYRPRRYDGSVLLVVNQKWNESRPGLGWDSRICPNLAIRVVPGDHITRFKYYGEIVGETLLGCLDDA